MKKKYNYSKLSPGGFLLLSSSKLLFDRTLKLLFLLLLSTLGFAQSSVSLVKSTNKTEVDPGEHITYTIQYNCTSITEPCLNVVITDYLNPNYVAFVSTVGGVWDNGTKTVTFALGDLPAGTTGEVRLTSTPTTNNPGGTIIPNTAQANYNNGTQTSSNTVETLLKGVFSIRTIKEAINIPNIGFGQLARGSEGFYSVVIQNRGNVTATNMCVWDSLPSPDMLRVNAVTTGLLGTNGYVNIEYTTNVNNSWVPLSGSPFLGTANANVPISLPVDQWVTKVRFCYVDPFPGNSSDLSRAKLHFVVSENTPLGNLGQNCFKIRADQGVGNELCSNLNIVPPINGPILAREKRTEGGNYQIIGDTLSFFLQVHNNPETNFALQNGIVGDVMNNSQLQYIEGSWTYDSNYGATAPTFTKSVVGENTILRWSLSDDLPVDKVFIIRYKAKLVTLNTATMFNLLYTTGSNLGACLNEQRPDIHDINQNGNLTETVCFNYAEIFPQSIARLTSEKLVKGQLDAVYSKYPAYGLTVPGGDADYRLRVTNDGSVAMTDVVVVDVLPFIGDRGVLDPQDRLTEWRPNLAGPVTPPSGVTVYYSSQQNPCRPELNYSPAGCTAAGWSLTPPADITTVQALKFDFGSMVLNPGDSFIFSWPMRAPTTAPTNGEIAWNSFGYIGTRVDNNSTLLAAEPIKVGIKVNPLEPAVYGDLVWFDTNENGLQDTGELGVPGVRVELYRDNGDGTANKATDIYIGFTITDGSGNYLFSSLDPGDYFAIFYPPAGYTVSPSLVGSNKAIDSEGIIAAITNLEAGETDLTWDLGIYESAECDVVINSTTVSPCSYSGASSTATVNVFITWANAPAGKRIAVTISGLPTQYIDPSNATSPALVSFVIAADGNNHTVSASFEDNVDCKDEKIITAPLPCAPAVC